MNCSACFKGSGLNCILHWRAYSCVFLRSLFKFCAEINKLEIKKSLTLQFRSSDLNIGQKGKRTEH